MTHEVKTAQQLLAVNREITAAIVREATPALVRLTPAEHKQVWPSVKQSMLRRASGGFTLYSVPIEGGSHDMTSYRDIRVTAVTVKTDIRQGRTPVTVKKENSIEVGYARLGTFPISSRTIYPTEIGMTDEGDVSYCGSSAYPSRGTKGDLYYLKRAAVQVQGLAEAAVAMIQETTGVQVAAAADLSDHAVEWRKQFPDLRTGPYMPSLIFMPRRTHASLR